MSFNPASFYRQAVSRPLEAVRQRLHGGPGDVDPTSPPDGRARRSIELRSLLFF